jgi:Icc protein
MVEQENLMRLVWTTDPHLNHVPVNAWEHWVQANRSAQPQGILITGDISEGDDVVFQLQRIAESLPFPIYFVLGNHDFYQSSIGQTRRRVIEACREHPRLFYLTDLDPLEMPGGAFLLGDDGWGDGTVGDYEGSPVRINDFELIDEFKSVAPSQWKQLLQDQGEQSARRLRHKLRILPGDTRSVIVLTHVPPFREACWYQGNTTDDNWAPFFVCGEVGKALLAAAAERPACKITVLCGHTHNSGVAKLSENLVVYTGAADYGAPIVEGIVQVGSDVEVQPRVS